MDPFEFGTPYRIRTGVTAVRGDGNVEFTRSLSYNNSLILKGNSP